jgi:hypothetical protein
VKITVESTSKIVEVMDGGDAIRCRVWEGESESGVRIYCLIARVAANSEQDLSQFDAELKETREPSPEIRAIPLRLIL